MTVFVQMNQERKSDIDLRNRIGAALGVLGYCCLDDVNVVAHEEHVVLTGRVPIYELARLAESIALAQPGCRSVENFIEVESAPAPQPRGVWARTLEYPRR